MNRISISMELKTGTLKEQIKVLKMVTKEISETLKRNKNEDILLEGGFITDHRTRRMKASEKVLGLYSLDRIEQ